MCSPPSSGISRYRSDEGRDDPFRLVHGDVMNFDPTVTLGNVIAIVSILGTGMVLYAGFVKRFDRMEFKVNLLWKWFKTVHNIPNDGE